MGAVADALPDPTGASLHRGMSKPASSARSASNTEMRRERIPFLAFPTEGLASMKQANEHASRSLQAVVTALENVVSPSETISELRARAIRLLIVPSSQPQASAMFS